VKARVQHPQVKVRKTARAGRGYSVLARRDPADGSVKTLRSTRNSAPARASAPCRNGRPNRARQVLSRLNAPTTEEAVQQVASTGVAFFDEVARMYEEGYLAANTRLANRHGRRSSFTSTSTSSRVGQASPQSDPAEGGRGLAAHTFDSWWTMHGVRAIMSRIFYYAEGMACGKREGAARRASEAREEAATRTSGASCPSTRRPASWRGWRSPTSS